MKNKIDTEDYTLLEFESKMSKSSKIRRLFFPISWDEFILRPVFSIIQFASIAALMIFLFSLFTNKNTDNLEKKINSSVCLQEVNETTSRINSLDFTIFQIGKKINRTNSQTKKDKLELLSKSNKELKQENLLALKECEHSPQTAYKKTKDLTNEVMDIKQKVLALKKN